jgi:glycosyltransferase involved in cell wall biosynthesis
VPDYITDGKTGIILTGDPDNDAERIAALVDEDSPLVKALEEGAVTLRGRSLTWQECVGRYFDAYGEYLGACS